VIPSRPAFGHVGEGNAPPLRGGLAQHQRGAGGRIDLVAVVLFDHLDVEFGVEGRRDLLHEAGQEVHAKAHVAGAHDRGVARGGVQRGKLVIAEPGRPDDMHAAGLRRQLRMGQRRRRRGEVDHRLRLHDRVERIGIDRHAHPAASQGFAEVAPDPVMSFALGHGDQVRAVRLGDRVDQHPAHPARCAHHRDANTVSHLWSPSRHAALGSIPWRRSAKAVACGRRLHDLPPEARGAQTMAKNRHHEGSGPSQRQLRVGELIRRTLSGVLARGEVHDPELNALSITVGEVRASPDLKIATVYVMPLGGGGREDAIAALKRNRGELRRALMREMTLKYAPDLRFVIDDTFDRMDDTRRLFEDDRVRRDIEAAQEEGEDGS
jgi:ribosome-binding factor A